MCIRIRDIHHHPHHITQITPIKKMANFSSIHILFFVFITSCVADINEICPSELRIMDPQNNGIVAAKTDDKS
ncbi:unnamed protein product [Thlaspi arvense]|uniref:Uncharacterized protein n=1 Tax=Thlaspi arvense TaxID=13288 RepID=A0AAU9SNG5_THLAR|nr:unnamed protein product [Thlaspi arvense]